MAYANPVPYVGPYTGAAYDAANKMNQNGSLGFVGPYNPATYDAAYRILGINNPQQPPVNNQVSGGGGGGGGGTQYQDTSAARAGTQTSLDSIDGILNNKLREARGEYEAILKSYAADELANKDTFDKKLSQNEGNRESQQQAALLAAANGSRGLYSALASIGALGGTGKVLANRAVSNEANVDIGNANKTFDTNSGALYDSYGELKKQEDQRKRDAELTLKKSEQALRYDATSQRQQLLKDMADLWGKAGNFGQSDRYTGDASKLTADLMKNTRPNVGTYATSPLQYSAPALQNYLAGANDMTVSTSAGGGQLPINGAIYTSTKKRDEL
jgi:hypothetical protein